MKIKFGAIVTDGRGKIGGHVASKNRAGAYLRTKVTPSNPNSIAQATARGLLASFSQGWAGLTDEQRKSWNNAVADWSKTDIFGDIKNPTGLNLYVKLNANLANVEEAFLTVPPAKVEVPTAYPTAALFSVAEGSVTFIFSDSTGDGVKVLVRATPQLSAGINSVSSQLRVIGYSSPSVGSMELADVYQDKFGMPAIGSNVYVSTQFVMETGQKTVPFRLKMLVVA